MNRGLNNCYQFLFDGWCCLLHNKKSRESGIINLCKNSYYKIIASLNVGISLTASFKNKYHETAMINDDFCDPLILELISSNTNWQL